MPALTSPSSWNLSTVTLASSKSQKGNKLRRRRRPPPLRDMSGANGHVEAVPPMPTPTTASSTVGSSSPTLHEKPISDSRERDADKDDAQAQVITSLRAQITDLISQVSQLNGKLVKSYDRVSDLEDGLHVASSNARTASLKISNLEIERAQHLAALNTGLYVEKAHVTAELTRLMERATSEAAARGQAENARQNIEQELDDLSAALFDQANTMVAEARLGRARSERKVVEAELALKGAEEAVGVMQLQMQSMRDEKDRTADEISRLRALMQKGKFVENTPMFAPTSLKLLRLHAPYQEYMQFIVHLRSIRHSTVNPPQISTLLPLPFLARLQMEDSDPTVRLDLAPSLNWLSRRSVLTAIHCGQLIIEPVSIATLQNESTSGLQSIIAGSQPGIVCALCGAHIYPPKSSDTTGLPPPTHPLSSLYLGRHVSSNAWSSTLFKNPLSNVAPSPPLTPPPRDGSVPVTPTRGNANSTTIYVFRVAQAQIPQHPPNHAQFQQTQAQRPTNYPLCTSGWCLARLRMTCSLWAFVRAGLIDRVWDEEPAPHPAPSLSSASAYSLISIGNNASVPNLPVGSQKEAAPPLPPRRKSKMSSSVGALWGMASGALRSASTPGQSQPSSPSRKGSNEKEELPDTPTRPRYEEPKKAALEPLKVVIPPPLPRRSGDRRVTGMDGVNVEKNGGGSGTDGELRSYPRVDSKADSSPTEASKSEKTSTSENTPVARSGIASPVRPKFEPGHITHTNSQASSAPSGGGDEFTTPVEEISSLPLSFSSGAADPTGQDISARPVTPHSPPRSPRPNARNSMSPPRSPTAKPQRMSSPPLPRSPRAIPLPDSRPGTPGTPHRTRARPESASASIIPLNINHDSGSRPPSRAASPTPMGPPPPVPRRAAARRAVPPPPSASQASPPPSSGSVDEKGTAPPISSESQKDDIAQGRKSIDAESPSKLDARENKPRISVDMSRPPPVPPRRPEHVAHNSTSGFGNEHDDGRMEAVQDRPRRGMPEADQRTIKIEGDVSGEETSKNFAGDATWEERTWKEIVRLREDMFWARIGGIRG